METDKPKLYADDQQVQQTVPDSGKARSRSFLNNLNSLFTKQKSNPNTNTADIITEQRKNFQTEFEPYEDQNSRENKHLIEDPDHTSNKDD